MERKGSDVPLVFAYYVILASAIGFAGSCDIMSAAKCTDNITVVLSSAEGNPNDSAGKLCTIRLGDIETCLDKHLLGCAKDRATNVDTMKIRYEKMKANLTHICNNVNGCENMVQRSLDLSNCFSTLDVKKIEASDKDQSCSTMSTLTKCIDKNIGNCDFLKRNFMDNIRLVNEQVKKMDCSGSSKSSYSLIGIIMAALTILLVRL